MGKQVSDIEELKRWIAVMSRTAEQADAKDVQLAVDAMLSGSATMTKTLQKRCDALAKQVRPNRPISVSPSQPKPTRQPVTKSNKDGGENTVSGSVKQNQPSKPHHQPTDKQQYLQKVYAPKPPDAKLLPARSNVLANLSNSQPLAAMPQPSSTAKNQSVNNQGSDIAAMTKNQPQVTKPVSQATQNQQEPQKPIHAEPIKKPVSDQDKIRDNNVKQPQLTRKVPHPTEKQQYLNYVYGQPSDEKLLAKAAKALTR